MIVGPDGVGKSGLAQALVEIAPGESGYFHFRPPFRGRLRSSVPTAQQPTTKNRGTPSLVVGWLRLSVAFVRFWAGYLLRVRPVLGRGGLVVGDRWAYGYLVQPRALRYGGPPWLASFMIKSLPSPDLVVNLTAPPQEIHRRKQELTVTELCSVLQLPQSTVSRHLKALGDAGWVSARAEGTSNLYAMTRGGGSRSHRGESGDDHDADD